MDEKAADLVLCLFDSSVLYLHGTHDGGPSAGLFDRTGKFDSLWFDPAFADLAHYVY